MRFLLVLAVLLCAGCSPSGSEDAVAENIQAPKPPQDENIEDQSAGGKDQLPTITYPGINGPMPMDVVKPTPKASLHRAVILIHGGGWVSGSRKELSTASKELAKQGFLALPIEYTLVRQAGGTWPQQLQDVQAAVRYVRRHAAELDVNPEWIAAAGVSAGGHLSMWLGVVDAPEDGISSRVQAVGSISGIHDLNAPLTPDGERYRIVQALMGERGAPDPTARAKASPVESVSRSSAPVLFIQGDADPLVPRAQSDLAAKRLRQAGVETRVLMVKGMHHGLDLTQPEERKALDVLAAWLKRHLKAPSK
jgi:acetyl esterase/lipase